MPNTARLAPTYWRPCPRSTSYRDALRIAGNRIDSALLLVPRSEGASWLKDPAFIREHSVGVIDVASGVARDGLTSVIGDLVAGP